MVRSASVISVILSSTSLSPSAFFLFARASAFSSWARAFIAACSSYVNPLNSLLIAVVLLGVAYRMLGSLSEADDAVQETWLRFSRSDTSGVANLGGLGYLFADSWEAMSDLAGSVSGLLVGLVILGGGFLYINGR
jgi:hypothetical protein